MRSLLPHLSLAVGLALGLAAASLGAQQPEFQQLDAGKLKVKVKKVEDSMDGLPSALLTVTVSNPTDYWAEPTEFLFKLKGVDDVKVQRAPRVEAPYHGRAGRAIPPGGKLDYVLAMPREPKQISKNGAKVAHASFFTGTALEEAPVEVGEIDEATPEKDFQGNVTKFARVQLKNNSAHTVDVVLRAAFKQPRDGEALVRFRLGPQEERRCTVEGPQVSFRAFADLRGSDLKSVELVDWSALRGGEEDPGRELLRAAFEAQARFPWADFGFEAEYELEVDTWDWNERERVKRKEQGRCHGDGLFARLVAEGAGTEQSMDGVLVSMALQEALEHLYHADFESFLGKGRAVLHTHGKEMTVVGVVHPPDRSGLDRWYWISDGLIVAQAGYPFSGTQDIYERGKVGGHEVITAVRNQDLVYGPSEWDNSLEVAYREVDGVAIPVEVKRTRRFNPEEQNEYLTLKLDKVKILAGPPPEGGDASHPSRTAKDVPGGPLVEELRAAWERAYRYQVPVDLHGKFRLTNNGKDALWQGHEELSGTFHISGFHGQGFADAEIKLDGDFREELAYQLADVVRDRFGMYMGRDFCGRKSFDEQFAGARLEKKGSSILVHDNVISAVELRAGRLHQVNLMTERKLTWRKEGDTEVLTRAEMNKERIEYDRELIGSHWLPVEVRMYDVFEDWGPEIFSFSELRVAPSTAE